MNASLMEMLTRFVINLLVVWVMIHGLYYRKSHRRDYYFTFMLISISIFFLIYLLGDVKIKLGFALGLFAVFGIIRYRTESMPVREMTYLFCIISISVIDALADNYTNLLVTDAIILLATWLFESYFLLKEDATKLVQYDRVELVAPDRREELMDDLKARTGLNIIRVEVGGIDFLRDTVVLKIHYLSGGNDKGNAVNHTLKISQEEGQEA